MKEYKKAQMIAKNLPTGSYAAGCPAKDSGYSSGAGTATAKQKCKNCERTS